MTPRIVCAVWLLAACGGEAPAAPAEEPPVEPAPTEVAPPAPVPAPVEPVVFVAPTPRDPSLDVLPEVGDWLPDAPRCGRHRGRRFCNGPRRVPAPEGEAAARSERLGLGSHRGCAELIRTRPRPEWLEELRTLGIAAPDVLVWPVDEGRLGRGLQWRGRRITHRGIDVTAEVGTPVRAVADALVAYADNTVRGYGNLLVLLHGGGHVSSYAHLSAIHVAPGQTVRAGQVMALAGNTGISRGPHLHMEWRESGELADPTPRFPAEVLPDHVLRAQGRLEERP